MKISLYVIYTSLASIAKIISEFINEFILQ